MIKDRKGDYATRVCDDCGHEQTVGYWNLYKKEFHYCRACSNKRNGHAKVGKHKSWNKGKTFNPRSIGNTYLNSNGYFEVYIGKHTLPEKAGGYYREHTLMAEVDSGRVLQEKEMVHHIDGDKTNNCFSNLSIMVDNAEHRRVHSQLERLSMYLVRMNVIQYDKENKEYKLAPQVRDYLSKSGELLGSPNVDDEGNQQRSFREMSSEERSETIQKWSTLKRVEAPDILLEALEDDDIVPSS